jgi:hypothetical protein
MNQTIPYRIDLAGGWLDQPFVSKLYPGPVITVSIEPGPFNERSGLASSTRKRALEIWPNGLPDQHPELLGKLLFCYENPPGTTEFSGSQDALGIVSPGVNRFDYNGGYWPETISSIIDEPTLAWLESRLYLVELLPREAGYQVLEGTNVCYTEAMKLSMAANRFWCALCDQDAGRSGEAMTRAFNAQVAMFPRMKNLEVETAIEQYQKNALGWKVSGAGGGGYLVLFSEKNIPGALRVTIRRVKKI